MQIFDHYYLITTTTIVVGVCILLYMKIGVYQSQPFHVTISGSNIQSFLLAYQISKLDLPNLNITLIGQFDQQFMKIAEAQLKNDMPNVASLNNQYIDRRIIEFCGKEPLLKQLIQDTHLQFKIKRSQILFSREKQKQWRSTYTQQNSKQRYTIDQQRKNMFNSIMKYGLSHVTAMSMIDSIQQHLQTGIDSNINEISMRAILNKLIPYPYKPTEDGIEFLSTIVGLDQKYIHDYVYPIIQSSFIFNVNSVAAIFKLMPLYCKTDIHNGRTKNLVLHLNQRMISAKILVKLKDQKNINIKRMKVKQFSEKETNVLLTIQSGGVNNAFSTDLLVILQDYVEEKQTQTSYHRSVVDGIITEDDQLEQFYTIHYQNSPNILSVTRMCANQCKNFRNSAYLVISKQKLKQKDLTMFSQHQILNMKKYKNARSQLPSSIVKFQQTPHILRVSDTQLISDNIEMKLIVFKNIANLIKKQALTHRPFEVKKKRQQEEDSN